MRGRAPRPFPEWVFPPINITNTSGTVVFDRMLSWWSRYIGISPVFREPIRLTIEKNRITRIEGGDESDRLRRFLKSMEPKVGDAIYEFPEIHSGVHPQALVSPQQCDNPLIRRLVDHSDAMHHPLPHRRAGTRTRLSLSIAHYRRSPDRYMAGREPSHPRPGSSHRAGSSESERGSTRNIRTGPGWGRGPEVSSTLLKGRPSGAI